MASQTFQFAQYTRLRNSGASWLFWLLRLINTLTYLLPTELSSTGALNTDVVYKFHDFVSNLPRIAAATKGVTEKLALREIYASRRSNCVKAAAAAERTPTPVSHMFLPVNKCPPPSRAKLSPVKFMLEPPATTTGVPHMFPPSVKFSHSENLLLLLSVHCWRAMCLR